MIDKTNKPWNNNISDEDIYNSEFTIGYLIQSNKHMEVFRQLCDTVLSTYRVKARFEYLGYNGDTLICNNQTLVYRPNKRSDFKTGKDVIIISHNLSHTGGGSVRYPRISHEEAFVECEFISYGLPYVNKLNGWSIKIIEMIKI